MPHVTKAQLRHALEQGCRLDGSGYVLKNGGKAVKFGPRLPPFEQATFQSMEQNSTGLPVEQFEVLSLGARAVAAGTDCASIGLEADSGGALRPHFPVIRSQDLQQVIAEAAALLETPAVGEPDHRHATSAAERAHARGGIQIVGCRIEGPPLQLSSLRLPFSIRLIGCVIECDVIANHCELQTLDLSGSALCKLDAAFIRTQGNVRLRRTTFLSPTSFGGAIICGVFDASDSVMQPRLAPAGGSPWPAERGMLNLGRARFQNEVYLNRVRIWGGLSLRGAVMERSLFLNRAIIRSPVGVLERFGREALRDYVHAGGATADAAQRRLAALLSVDTGEGPNANQRTIDELWRLVGDSDRLARHIHKAMRANERLFENLVTAEVLGVNGLGDDLPAPLRQLLCETFRARTSAIRCDSMVVGGNIFARRLRTVGRIRLNYARIGDGLHIEGSTLRSVASIGRVLDTFAWISARAGGDAPGVDLARRLRRVDDDRRETWTAARPSEDERDDDYALDMREAVFGGSVVVSGYEGGPPAESGERETRPATRLDGVIAADRVKIGGDFSLRRLDVRFAPRRSYKERSEDEREKHRAIAYDWDRLERQMLEDTPSEEFDGRDPATIRLYQARVDGDIDLRGSQNVHGLDLENSVVGGGLYFADKIRRATRPEIEAEYRHHHEIPAGQTIAAETLAAEQLDQWVAVPTSARRVRATVCLRSTRIEGDAFLVFHPENGPKIEAELARIGGRLDIYPALDDDPLSADATRGVEPDAPLARCKRLDYQQLTGLRSTAKAARWTFRLNQKALARDRRRAAQPQGLRRVLDTLYRLLQRVRRSGVVRTVERMPLGRQLVRLGRFLLIDEEPRPAPPPGEIIDLRNAKAAIFCHPPIAWPNVDRLSLEGFSYDRTSPYGPIAPHPFPRDRWFEPRFERSERRARLRQVLNLRRGLLILVTVIGFCALWWLAANAAEIAKLAALLIDHGGRQNLVALGGLLVTIGSWVAMVNIHHPHMRPQQPMALDYLALQPISTNRYRTPGSIYWSLDPYVRAAKVLRDEGRPISANAVEAERLKRRTRMFSWRHHFLAKVGLRLVQLFANYGFDVSRAVVSLAVLVLIGATLAHTAKSCEALAPAESGVSAVHVTLGPGVAIDAKDGAKPAFSSFWYAVDTIVPFLDFEESKAWEPVATHNETKCKAWPDGINLQWRPILAVLGLMLTTITAAALGTRAESAFRRVEE